MVRRLSADVAIIGGGLVGSSAALALCKAGLSVVLLDKGYCGAQASGINYGGVRRQGRSVTQLPLAQRAHNIWPTLPQLIGSDGEYHRSGHLKLARTEEEFAQLEAYAVEVRPHGLKLELLSPAMVKERLPWLSGEVAGASFCLEDGSANPRLVSPGFARAAERNGAVVLEQMPVREVRTTGFGFAVLAGVADRGESVEISCTRLINSAGAWADQFASSFGEAVPLARIYPSMIVTEPLPIRLHLSTGEQSGSFYGRQVSRGNYIMGGGRAKVLANADYSRPSMQAASQVMQRAVSLFPYLKTAQVIRFWSGTEAEMPDDNPVLGPSSTTPDLYHAFGFCGAGFQTAPAVGEVLCELITTGETSTPIETYAIDRFAAAATPASIATQVSF